jgi:hypothetical protein
MAAAFSKALLRLAITWAWNTLRRGLSVISGIMSWTIMTSGLEPDSTVESQVDWKTPGGIWPANRRSHRVLIQWASKTEMGSTRLSDQIVSSSSESASSTKDDDTALVDTLTLTEIPASINRGM